MKKFVFFLGLLISFTSFSQNDEEYIDILFTEFTSKLKERGIDQYFATKHYCSGTTEMFLIDGKMCTSRGTYFEVYVFWEEDENHYIKKIDNCGLFRSETLTNAAIYDFVSENFEAIKEKEVKTYKSDAFTGEPQLRTNVQPCFRAFFFAKGGETFHKKFNLFDISNDSEGKNLNYDYNQSLPLVQLNSDLESLIAGGSFERQ